MAQISFPVARFSKDDSYLPQQSGMFSLDVSLSLIQSNLNLRQLPTPTKRSFQIRQLHATARCMLKQQTPPSSPNQFQTFQEISNAALALEMKPFRRPSEVTLVSSPTRSTKMGDRARRTKGMYLDSVDFNSSISVEEEPISDLLSEMDNLSAYLCLDSVKPLKKSKTFGMFDQNPKPEDTSSLRFLSNDAKCRGWLCVHQPTSGLLKRSWKKRYFVLADSTLHRFRSTSPDADALDSLTITRHSSITIEDKNRLITITSRDLPTPLILRAESAGELAYWHASFKQVLLDAKSLKKLHPAKIDSYRASTIHSSVPSLVAN